MPKLRTVREFAEQEIVIPDGPFRGRRWRAETQPYAALWFDLLMRLEFNRFAATGPSQSGKTLHAYVIPTMWHLFEIGENVGCGVPSMDMAFDKWTKDFQPAIAASRFSDLIPTTGGGSRGGKFESITFKNGATLKFLTAGGGDKKRAGYTIRVLIMTEVDGFDTPGEMSREADPIVQMEARTNSYGPRKRVYLECTPSIEEGRIWQEYLLGTNSKIVLPCPHCDEWVSPEREHLLGWQDAPDEIAAQEKAKFFCPACGTGWSDAARVASNRAATVIHRGQSIDKKGRITGPVPRTMTFSLRWSAVNNLFASPGDLGLTEWRARRDVNEQNAEKNLNQFVWATPVKPSVTDETPLDIKQLLDRTHTQPRKIIPQECELLTAAMDLGGSRCYWTVIAWGPHGRGYVIDYGWLHVAQAMLGVETALVETMRQFRDLCHVGWEREDREQLIPTVAVIDSGWKTTIVYDFIRETGVPYWAAKGLHVDGQAVSYSRPKSTGSIVQWIGDGWHVAKLKEDGFDLLEIDADYAKTTLHARISCDVKARGAITFFPVDRQDAEATEERYRFMRHLTAEKSTEEFIPGKGMQTHWVNVRRDNHWLDSTALALMGGNMAGVKVIEISPGAEMHVPTVKGDPTAEKAFVREMAPRSSSGWGRRRKS